MKEHLIDKRVVQRALQEGLLDKDVYQRMLDELPDLSDKVQTAAESQALEAASQAAARSSSGVHAATYDADDLDDDDDLDDEDDLDDDEDDEDDEDDVEGDDGQAEKKAAPDTTAAPEANAAPAAGQPVSDTLEMERPRIPGSYNPDY